MKILSFGFGSIAQRHICNLASLYSVKDLFVYLPASNGSPKYRPHYNQPSLNPYCVCSPDHLCKVLPTLCSDDLILIASPSIFHVDQLLLSLSLCSKTDQPRIIVEKPLATSSAQLQLLTDVVKQSNPDVFVVSQYRANTAFGRLLDIIHNCELGPLRFASINTHEAVSLWHPWEDYRASYSVNRSLGGGCLLTQMHDLDLLSALLGLPSKTDIRRGNGQGLQIDCDDYYSLSMSGFEQPSICNVNVQVSYYSNVPLRDYLLVFDDGIVHADLLAPSLTIKQGDGTHVSTLVSNRNAMYESIAEAVFARSPSPRSGLVSVRESLLFHSWLCGLVGDS